MLKSHSCGELSKSQVGVKVTLAGWVANRIDPDMAAYDENLASLAERLPAPLLAEFPYWQQTDPGKAARCLSPHGLSKWLAGLDAQAS